MDFDIKGLGRDLTNKIAVNALEHLKENPDKLRTIAEFIVDHLIDAIKPEVKP